MALRSKAKFRLTLAWSGFIEGHYLRPVNNLGEGTNIVDGE